MGLAKLADFARGTRSGRDQFNTNQMSCLIVAIGIVQLTATIRAFLRKIWPWEKLRRLKAGRNIGGLEQPCSDPPTDHIKVLRGHIFNILLRHSLTVHDMLRQPNEQRRVRRQQQCGPLVPLQDGIHGADIVREGCFLLQQINPRKSLGDLPYALI